MGKTTAMKIDFENLKSIIKEIEETKEGGDGWEAWSALCLWLAQYEYAQQNVNLTTCQCGKDCIPMLGEDTCVRCDNPIGTSQ